MFTQLTMITNLQLKTVHAHMNQLECGDDEDELEQEDYHEDAPYSDDPYILEKFFEDLESSTNASYYPFPSTMFALLYFLVYSPHPVVSFKSKWT